MIASANGHIDVAIFLENVAARIKKDEEDAAMKREQLSNVLTPSIFDDFEACMKFEVFAEFHSLKSQLVSARKSRDISLAQELTAAIKSLGYLGGDNDTIDGVRSRVSSLRDNLENRYDYVSEDSSLTMEDINSKLEIILECIDKSESLSLTMKTAAFSLN